MAPTLDRWDVVVAGVGGMGSAALFHLARRGCRVLGLERFGVPNDRGSSHGRSRTIRLTVPAGGPYVPLVRRAYALWRELERISGERLLRVIGSLDAGPADGMLFREARDVCRAHGFDHEILDSRELSSHMPGFRLPAHHRAVFQPGGGVLDPERCVESHVRFAESLGATLRTGVRVEGFQSDGEGIRVRVLDDAGEREEHLCEGLVLTAGPWTAGILGAGAPPLVAERQVTGWFRPPAAETFAAERFPAFQVEVPEGRFHGSPDLEDGGFETGRFHHLAEPVDPDETARSCSEPDGRVLRDFVDRYLPDGAGALERMETCLFTNTPDGHFVLDRLPRDERVVLAAGFSGQGFKFASVVGEILADLALGGTGSYDLEPFALRRFHA